MVSASYQQVSFLGGEWSRTAQGRMTDPNYQRSMGRSVNGMPIEAGSWTRRPGFRFLGITRHGAPAKLFQFDFSTTQPYQIELSDGFLRLWAGLAIVLADDDNGYTILGVTQDNPAVVAASNIPNTWANGDTVVFFINTEPCSAPLLCNRQFTIQNVDTAAGTFTLHDAVTGAAVDGATLAYAMPAVGAQNDRVGKVFELATPYTGDQWQAVRLVHNDTEVTLFHPLYAPRTLAQAVSEPFALTVQALTDGPYLDINETTTTLTPSGVSGSITMTASSTIGINGGSGFLSTDVGRLIRFQSAPPVWDDTTSYAKKAQVVGSDNNIYQAVQKSTNKDPTTDDGTNWLVVGMEPTWVWMTITAVTNAHNVVATVNGVADASQITATILGNTLSSLSAQRVWRLGFYSDTTGWPVVGSYHDNRLWLGNEVTANRFDGSVSDDFFNFCPTADDGTVADDNAVSATFNADEVDAVFWLLSTDDGLLIGTQGSEWRIRASNLDDPITPTSIQARRVSKFGSFNAEAIFPWGRPLFLQRHQRKLLALRQVSETKYDGDNISRCASQFMASGVEEIRWQQEPTLTIWLRQSNGGLAGCVYRSSAYSFSYSQSLNINDENFQGFFSVEHAYARVFDSISTGPSYDGLGSALYAVTNQLDQTKADYGVHHVEYLMPLFDDSVADWGSFFVDGGATPCCARKFLVSNGDAFNGVRLYGLTYLNGLQTSVVIGGLDLGDYTVANGYVDIHFGTPVLFTEAFFNAQDNGTDYGAFGGDFSFVTTSVGSSPPHAANTIGSWVNAAETHGNFAFADINGGVFYGLNSQDAFLDVFDYTSFSLTNSTALATVLGTHTLSAAAFAAHSDGFLYMTVTDPGIVQINPTTHAVTGFIGTSGQGGSDPDGRQFLPFIQGVDVTQTNTQTGMILDVETLNVMAVVGVTSVSQEQRVTLLDTTHMTWITNSSLTIDEDNATLTVGAAGELMSSFYVLGSLNNYTSGAAIGLYRGLVGGGAIINTIDGFVSYKKIATLAPADVDPTWTTYGVVTTPIFCQKDGTICFGVSCTDTVTNKEYFLKFDPIHEAIVWKTALPLGTITQPSDTARKRPFSTRYGWNAHGTGGAFYLFDLTAGTFATHAFQTVFQNLGADFFDDSDGSLVCFNPEWAWASNPFFLGAWSLAHGAGSNNGKASRLYFGLDGAPTSSSRQYHVASSVGLTYTSQGQLLPPNFGPDAGARNGPAFGKKRRNHWYAAQLYRTGGDLKFGTNFAALRPAPMTSDGGTPPVAPALFSNTVSTTVDDDYSFQGAIAWQVTRPYPVMITAMGGYIETQDK